MAFKVPQASCCELSGRASAAVHCQQVGPYFPNCKIVSLQLGWNLQIDCGLADSPNSRAKRTGNSNLIDSQKASETHRKPTNQSHAGATERFWSFDEGKHFCRNKDGRLWASVLAGPQGFLQSPQPSTLTASPLYRIPGTSPLLSILLPRPLRKMERLLE